MTQSAASNLLLQIGDCHKRILLPATDANAEVKETPGTGSEKKRLQTKRKAIAWITNLDNSNHHGTSNMISPFSLQEAQLDESTEKILLPPTDPNAEVQEIPPYKLVYVNGACPRNYRVYKGHSMIGVIFQYITHWSNGVDSLRYAESVDAAIGLDEFMNVVRVSKAATEQPLTEQDLLDKEFDAPSKRLVAA